MSTACSSQRKLENPQQFHHDTNRRQNLDEKKFCDLDCPEMCPPEPYPDALSLLQNYSDDSSSDDEPYSASPVSYNSE